MNQKSLLVRTDFLLANGQASDRRCFHRWRRVFREGLPLLLGCASRCPRAEHVCLHRSTEGGRFSAWLRLPVKRRPPRSRVKLLEKRIHERLSTSLQPIQGEVLKVRIRRCRPALEVLPLFNERSTIARFKSSVDTSTTDSTQDFNKQPVIVATT